MSCRDAVAAVSGEESNAKKEAYLKEEYLKEEYLTCLDCLHQFLLAR